MGDQNAQSRAELCYTGSMNFYEKLCALLKESPIRHSDYSPGELNYFNFPKDVIAQSTHGIRLLDGVLLFDANGNCIAEGSGDEQPSCWSHLH